MFEVEARPPSRLERLREWTRASGVRFSVPVMMLLAAGFAAPLAVIAGYSVMPPKTFDFLHVPTVENFVFIVETTYWRSAMWSFGLAAATVLLLLVVCYPLAYAMAKVFGRWAQLLMLVLVIPLFVSENIRLFGWVLFLVKGGVLSGGLKALFGVDVGGFIYNIGAIVLGLTYVYLPFMLFPLVLGIAMVPDEVRQAAADLGASRWQVFREVELPLSMPGVLIGSLLTFVLSVGSLAEAKILGGQAVIMIADDIESAFTYGQNWPLGSALSLLLVVLVGAMVIYVLRRLDLDAIMGRR